MNPWFAFIATLSLIIIVHEWGHFFMARRIGVKVERFSIGFGPKIITWRQGQTEFALSLLPFGGYVKLAGENPDDPGPAHPWEYRGRKVSERAAIVLAGPAINYLLGFALFFSVFLIGAPVFTTKIGQVLEDYPAAKAGVQAGDRVIAVGGKPVKSWEEMTQLIQSQGTTVNLTLERQGQQFQQVIQPKIRERKGIFGQTVRSGMVGITPSDETQVMRYPIFEAAGKALYQVWFLTKITLLSLWNLATGGLSFKESFTGPIGIFHITASVAAQGAVALMQLIAVLSTSIGLFNVLPIPVLDGGHLLFLGLEKLQGRAVSLNMQEKMTKVGLGFLLLLLAVVTYNDLLRFNIGGKLLSLFQ